MIYPVCLLVLTAGWCAFWWLKSEGEKEWQRHQRAQAVLALTDLLADAARSLLHFGRAVEEAFEHLAVVVPKIRPPGPGRHRSDR